MTVPNCAGAGLPGWGRGVSGSFRSTVTVPNCAGAGLPRGGAVAFRGAFAVQ